MRAVQAGLLAIAVCFSLGATDAAFALQRPEPPADVHLRMRGDSGRVQPRGLPRLVGRTGRAARGHRQGKSDKEILDSFVVKYGAMVLAAPTAQGFDLVAWIAPFRGVCRGAFWARFCWCGAGRWAERRRSCADDRTMDPAERERRETDSPRDRRRWRVLSDELPCKVNWPDCLLALALVVYTFWPENVFASQREKTRLDFLLERKEQLYENLRDLNFEYRAGKYPEEDFLAQRAQLENEAAQLLAEIERLERQA